MNCVVCYVLCVVICELWVGLMPGLHGRLIKKPSRWGWLLIIFCMRKLFYFNRKQILFPDKSFQFITHHAFSHTGRCTRKNKIANIHGEII